MTLECDALRDIEESARALLVLIERDVDVIWNRDAAAINQIAHHIHITAEAGLAAQRQPQQARKRQRREKHG